MEKQKIVQTYVVCRANNQIQCNKYALFFKYYNIIYMFV